ncbi:MAG: hypothetical protein HUN04_08730 [Desulfobacter sp.]|nr:MAG: hypothetical protein HUN04_08730 [Desulfobacter sp.]
MTTNDQSQTGQLKDYYCPFCNSKLFRGKVEEFKMVCLECNRLVDSKKLTHTAEEKNEGDDRD